MDLNHNRFVAQSHKGEPEVSRSRFTPRTILSDNVRALLKSKTGPNSQPKLEEKTKKFVSQNTISRIVSEPGENTSLENIAAIAAAYGLEAWQLLVPGMDPNNPPALAAVTKAEKELWAKLRGLMDDIKKQGGSE